MKKILTAGLLALGLALTSQQQASAWVNFKAGVGLNLQWQSGGNTLLWGAVRGGQPPGSEFFGYPSPQQFYQPMYGDSGPSFYQAPYQPQYAAPTPQPNWTPPAPKSKTDWTPPAPQPSDGKTSYQMPSVYPASYYYTPSYYPTSYYGTSNYYYPTYWYGR